MEISLRFDYSEHETRTGTKVKQGDSDIVISASVYKTDTYIINQADVEGHNAYLYFKRADGTTAYGTCEFNALSNKFTYECNGAEFNVAGRTYVDLKLEDEETGKIISTNSCVIDVIENTNTGDFSEKSVNYTELYEVVGDLEEGVRQAEEAIEEIDQKAQQYNLDEIASDIADLKTDKQDKLTAQTAYNAKGTSTKVPQITTNALGQVTNITEVDIEGGSGGTEVVEVTRAQYEALKPACLTDGKIYKITDEEDEPLDASNVTYNDTNVADALDIINNKQWKYITVTPSASITSTNLIGATEIVICNSFPMQAYINTNLATSVRIGLVGGNVTTHKADCIYSFNTNTGTITTVYYGTGWATSTGYPVKVAYR